MLQPTGQAVVEQIDDSQLKKFYEVMQEKGYSNEEKFADAIESGIVDLTGTELPIELSTEQSSEGLDNETQVEKTGETVQTTTEKQAASQKGKEEITTTPIDSKVDAQKYKTLQGILDARNRDYDQLQNRITQIEPYLKNLNDPQFQQHVLAYNPAGTPSIQQPSDVSKGDDEYMTVSDFRRLQEQERQQRQMMDRVQRTAEFQQNFARSTLNNREEIIKSGVESVEVDKAMQEFQNAFMSGNVYKLAHRAYNYDKAVEEAEKRGREKAFKEIGVKSSAATPRTVTAPSTKVSTTSASEWDDMGPAELKKYVDSLDPNSPVYEKFTRWLEKKANQK